MAKKVVKKYRVIHSLSEDGIRSIGINRWSTKAAYGFCVGMVLSFMLMLIFKDSEVKFLSGYLSVIPMVITFIGFVYGFLKAGKDFWNKVKDLPEPIDLDEVK